MVDISLSLIEYNQASGSRCAQVVDIIDSFSRQGQLSPICVRDHPTKLGKYQIVFGNRRLTAAKRLGWKTIAADIVKASDVEALIMSFSENVDRKDFSDYEKAFMLQKLHDVTGKSYTDIATYIGRSPAFVSQHVAMLYLFPTSAASDKERTTVLHALSENHARILARIVDDQERWNTAKLVVSANLGVRELQKICRSATDEAGVSDKNDNQIGESALGNTDRLNKSRQVQEIVTSIMKALSSKDILPFVEAVSAHHFSMFPSYVPSSSVIGGDDVKDYLFEALRQMSSINYGRPKYLEVHLYGNLAYVAMTLPREIVAGERLTKTTTRATIILEREKNSWKMVHVHWSTGFASKIDEVFPINIHGKAWSA